MSINICSKLNDLRSKDTVKMDLPDTSFNTTVEVLRQLITNQLQLSNDVDLIAFGKILRDDKSLAHYGIKGTTTVYIMKKRNVSHITCMSREAIQAAKATQSKPEGDLKSTAAALKLTLRNQEFRTMLTKLVNKEDQERLMAFTPGLREDPIVLSILQDPDLFGLCVEDVSNFTHVVGLHPVLAVAAENLAATFHETNPSAQSFSVIDNRPRYGLDDSDDDDDDDGESAAPPQPASAEVMTRFLREAITNAQNSLQLQQQGAASTSSGSQTARLSAPTSRSVTDGSQFQNFANPHASSSSTRPSAPVITTAMLEQALSNVRAPQIDPPVAPAPPPPPVARPPVVPAVPALRNWTSELAQLRELGISDDAYSIQILEATNGNVAEAVNILLGGGQN